MCRLLALVPAFMVTLALAAIGAGQARAVILPAVTLDGPSESIVGFGGAAMAEDGTGGVVYLKREEGVTHVFVARYVEGHWLAPIRVDSEQKFAASEPRIGAANGGELVVVWVTPFASEEGRPVDELLGATLGPGSQAFSPAMIVDRNIGTGIGASPAIAMSPTAQADVVYRVVTSREGEVTSIPLLHSTDVIEQVRVAHFNGARWLGLGAINRDTGLSMRAPTAANAPAIAIGPTGNAVVVWQEPNANGVARLWARRIFGTHLEYVMPASAEKYEGGELTTDAEAPSVALSRLGQAELAYRQPASPGSPLKGARVFLNILPDGESVEGKEFLGASIVDTEVSGGEGAVVGRPSIDVDEQQDMRLLYDNNGSARVIEGTDKGLVAALSLGPPFAAPSGTPANEVPVASVMNPAGGGVSAWPSVHPSGNPAVAVREDFPEGGGVQTALESGGAGGEIGQLAVGRSSVGDGIVAFQQGPLGDAAIVAAQVTAPPAHFVLSAPRGWVKPSQAAVSWVPANSAEEPVTYAVVLDGHPLPAPTGATSLQLDPRRLYDGVHHVEVLATDRYGDQTLSATSTLDVAGLPPRVSFSTRGHSVIVRVSDRDAGVDTKAVSVSFGDGGHAKGRTVLRHRYAHAGVYEVEVHVRDKIGNAGVVRRLVSVP